MKNEVDNYQLNLRKEFQLQREREQFTDLKIICANGTAHSHKVLLSHTSNEFWKLLLQNEEEDMVVLIPDETVENVSQWLNTIYNGTYTFIPKVKVCLYYDHVFR